MSLWRPSVYSPRLRPLSRSTSSFDVQVRSCVDDAYFTLTKHLPYIYLLRRASFTVMAVELVVIFSNSCDYCTNAHSARVWNYSRLAQTYTSRVSGHHQS